MPATKPLTFYLRYTFAVYQVTKKHPGASDQYAMHPFTKYELVRHQDADAKFDPHPVGFTEFTGDFPVALDVALARNAEREHPIPEEAIRRAYQRYTDKGELPATPLPVKPAPVETYVQDWNLETAFLVDLDGTLAHMNGRSPFHWDRVGEDVPDETVREVVRSLESDHHIVIMSGRDESCRDITEKWLVNNGIPYDELHMRPAGDTRRDDIVKHELFNLHVRNRFNVLGSIDDRNQVVRMWRAMGIKTLQAQEGDF